MNSIGIENPNLNMCYINAAIQCYLECTGFCNHILYAYLYNEAKEGFIPNLNRIYLEIITQSIGDKIINFDDFVNTLKLIKPQLDPSEMNSRTGSAMRKINLLTLTMSDFDISRLVVKIFYFLINIRYNILKNNGHERHISISGGGISEVEMYKVVSVLLQTILRTDIVISAINHGYFIVRDCCDAELIKTFTDCEHTNAMAVLKADPLKRLIYCTQWGTTDIVHRIFVIINNGEVKIGADGTFPIPAFRGDYSNLSITNKDALRKYTVINSTLLNLDRVGADTEEAVWINYKFGRYVKSCVYKTNCCLYEVDSVMSGNGIHFTCKTRKYDIDDNCVREPEPKNSYETEHFYSYVTMMKINKTNNIAGLQKYYIKLICEIKSCEACLTVCDRHVWDEIYRISADLVDEFIVEDYMIPIYTILNELINYNNNSKCSVALRSLGLTITKNKYRIIDCIVMRSPLFMLE